MRKAIATWAIVQFLFVWLYVGINSFIGFTANDERLNFADKFFSAWISLGMGLMGAAFSLGIPFLALWICGYIWKQFTHDPQEAGNPNNGMTLGDIAGIASAFHPRTGALLNVAANIDARTQALNVTPPAAPSHNPVDDERL
jgi:hypothetical protein